MVPAVESAAAAAGAVVVAAAAAEVAAAAAGIAAAVAAFVGYLARATIGAAGDPVVVVAHGEAACDQTTVAVPGIHLGYFGLAFEGPAALGGCSQAVGCLDGFGQLTANEFADFDFGAIIVVAPSGLVAVAPSASELAVPSIGSAALGAVAAVAHRSGRYWDVAADRGYLLAVDVTDVVA